MANSRNGVGGEQDRPHYAGMRSIGGTMRPLSVDIDLPPDLPSPEEYISLRALAQALGVSRSALRHYLQRRDYDLIRIRLYEAGGQATLALRTEDVDRFISQWTTEGRPLTSEALFLLKGKQVDNLAFQSKIEELVYDIARLGEEIVTLAERMATMLGLGGVEK